MYIKTYPCSSFFAFPDCVDPVFIAVIMIQRINMQMP